MNEFKVTPDEEKNGWTDETLRDYLQERDEARSVVIDVKNRPKRPAVQNNRYRPHRWRN